MSFVDINVLKRFAVNDQWLAANILTNASPPA
jgi:hypothetical protein